MSDPALSGPTTAGSRHVRLATDANERPRAKTDRETAGRRRGVTRDRPPRARGRGPAGPTSVADALVRLRRVRRQRRRQRAPRSGAEVGRCPGEAAGLALAGTAEDHRQLARAEREQERQDDDLRPGPDRGAEQAGHVAAVSRPPATASPSSRPPLAGSRMAPGFARVVVEMQEDVAEPATDHGAGHDPDGDEQEIVGPQGRTSRDDARHDQRGGDDDRQRDRLPADDERLGQPEQWVEVERDDGDRHGVGQCIEPPRRCAPIGVGGPTPALSGTGSPASGASRTSCRQSRWSRGGVATWLGAARNGGSGARRSVRRPAQGGTGRASRASRPWDVMRRDESDPTHDPSRQPARAPRRPDARRRGGATRGPPRAGAVRTARAGASTANARGDRRGPVAGRRQHVGRVASPGALARPPRAHRRRRRPRCRPGHPLGVGGDPPRGPAGDRRRRLRAQPRGRGARRGARGRALPRRPGRGPRPRLLRRRARATGRPLRGRARRRRPRPVA